MSTIIERAFKQYKTKMAGTTLLSVEVPEWPDDNGLPSVLYFRPASALRFREFSRFLDLARQQSVEAALDILMLRALDEQQNPLFKPAQRAELIRSLDPEVVLKIIKRMGEQEELYTAEHDEVGQSLVEVAEKNSERIPSSLSPFS